jgi:hypothetical protein
MYRCPRFILATYFAFRNLCHCSGFKSPAVRLRQRLGNKATGFAFVYHTFGHTPATFLTFVQSACFAFTDQPVLPPFFPHAADIALAHSTTGLPLHITSDHAVAFQDSHYATAHLFTDPTMNNSALQQQSAVSL